MNNRLIMYLLYIVYLIGCVWFLFFLFPTSIILPVSRGYGLLGIPFVLFSIIQSFRAWANAKTTICNLRISGFFTPLYAIYPFITSVILFIFDALVVGLGLNDGDISVYIVSCFVFFIWALVFNKYRQLKMIYIDDDRIHVIDSCKESTYSIDSIIKVTSYMIYLYKIEIKIEGSLINVVFMPRFRESFFPGSSPQSIIMLRKKLQHFQRVKSIKH